MIGFYIYIYLDPRKLGRYYYGKYRFDYEPFYVGKGSKDRGFKIKNKRRSNFLLNKIHKTGTPLIIIYKKGLSEKKAFNIEKELIKRIGRRDLKTGPLCNLTDGGEGISGHSHSSETKVKISKTHKGIKLTEDHKKKLSEAHKGNVPSDDTRRKISEGNKGKKVSLESINKMVLSRKGWSPSRETRDKIGNANRGKVQSIETKMKRSKTLKNNWDKKKGRGVRNVCGDEMS